MCSPQRSIQSFGELIGSAKGIFEGRYFNKQRKKEKGHAQKKAFLPNTCNISPWLLLLSVLIWISLWDEEYLGINWDLQARTAFEIRLISWCGWGWKSWIICWKGEKCRRRKFDILAPLSAQSSRAEPLWGWHFESNQNFSIPTWFSLNSAWEVLIWYCAVNQTPRPWKQNWTFTALFLPGIGNICYKFIFLCE